MPYSADHLRMLNTQPGNRVYYETITLKNVIAGEINLLVSGIHGPYKPLNFMQGGLIKTFTPVRAKVPQMSNQDVASNIVCKVQIGRVSSQAYDFLNSILMGALKPADKVIEAVLCVYDSTGSEPIFRRDLYVGADGVSIGQSDIDLTLEIDNPAKSQYAPFYNPTEFFSLLGG